MRAIRLLRAALLCACCALPCLSGAQTTISGVKYDDALQLGGSRLQLNGAGTRYKGPFKVYTAGLYLPKKSGTAEEVIAQSGAKRITVTMLRDIDATEMGKMFTRGMEDNMDRAAVVKLIPGIMRMSQVFSDHKKLQTGETFAIDWIPGTGTVLVLRGQPQGEPFREPEFFNALLRIWIGAVPADWKLKDSLLGKPS
ncbi:MAG TPA: chalcone isomerase family protein [Ramlibacter sp.]|uniref:chalcone isomerase family protein n=1 Tax=Ramlibacter sp. TaxID=1917967 RepID=UPI002ECFE413